MASKNIPNIQVHSVQAEGSDITILKDVILEVGLVTSMRRVALRTTQNSHQDSGNPTIKVASLKFLSDTGAMSFVKDDEDVLALSMSSPLLTRNTLRNLGIDMTDNWKFPLINLKFCFKIESQIQNCFQFYECFDRVFGLKSLSAYDQFILNFSIKKEQIVDLEILDSEPDLETIVADEYHIQQQYYRAQHCNALIPSDAIVDARWFNGDEVTFGLIKAFESFNAAQKCQIQLYDSWVFDYIQTGTDDYTLCCLRENFLEKKYHVYPCFDNNHWFLGIVEFIQENIDPTIVFKIWIFDSISSKERALRAKSILYSHFSAGLKKIKKNPNLIQQDMSFKDALKQKDGFNCGPFVILNAIRFFHEREFISDFNYNVNCPDKIREIVRACPSVDQFVIDYFSMLNDTVGRLESKQSQKRRRVTKAN